MGEVMAKSEKRGPRQDVNGTTNGKLAGKGIPPLGPDTCKYAKEFRRNQEIRRLFKVKKLTLEQLGEKYGLTKSRIGQIIQQQDRPYVRPGRPFKMSEETKSWLGRLGKNLRVARSRRMMTLESVSERTERLGTYVELSKLSKMERSKIKPTAREIIVVCKAMGVSLKEVWPHKDDRSGIGLLMELSPAEGAKAMREIGYSEEVVVSLFGKH